jgi:hypothetical protein
MSPIPEPPRQYLVGVTAWEADCARRFIAEALRPVIPEALRPYEEGAVIVFSRLNSVVDASKQPKVIPPEDGG